MGNSRWRLRTTLEYAAEQAAAIGRAGDVEIVVLDWGSDTPLQEVVPLSRAAARMVSFVHVPRDVTEGLEGDSPFPEVLALNAAARRARGDYIGRIDQDTLVGPRFLTTFFELVEGRRPIACAPDQALLFANLRFIPYRFAGRCPHLAVVRWLVGRFGLAFEAIEPKPPFPFYAGPVGICLMHRSLWFESGGYDERMIYMNAMETNLARRVLMKYEVIDLGALVGHDFYHLEHYHPRALRKSSSHRKVNPHLPFSDPKTFNPNGERWGLSHLDLALRPASLDRISEMESPHPRLEVMQFVPALLRILVEMALDRAIQ
jgi:hypothetical protein